MIHCDHGLRYTVVLAVVWFVARWKLFYATTSVSYSKEYVQNVRTTNQYQIGQQQLPLMEATNGRYHSHPQASPSLGESGYSSSVSHDGGSWCRSGESCVSSLASVRFSSLHVASYETLWCRSSLRGQMRSLINSSAHKLKMWQRTTITMTKLNNKEHCCWWWSSTVMTIKDTMMMMTTTNKFHDELKHTAMKKMKKN